MCDAADILCDPFHITLEDFRVDSPPGSPRPTTPIPDRSRTLRRTISHASIDTVRPPNKKGVRRRIEDMTENLKHKTQKKKKHLSTQDMTRVTISDAVTSDSKRLAESKAAKRGRKAALPLRDSPRGSEEASTLAVADRLHSGVPFDLDQPLTFPGCKSNPVIDVPLFKEDDETPEDYNLPIRILQPGPHVTAECQRVLRSPPIAKIEDVQLCIRAAETDMTIWDGLQAAHHVFKCRLFLRCTTHPYDSVSLPDIRRVEMECNTRPANSAYARLPHLQATYEGAAPGRVTNPSGLPNVNLAAGIHMDRVWCKIQDEDNTWGWYRDVFVPLSPRLFDKIEYREFKLIGRVWMGESCVDDELTFGISMLLRGVDMK